MKKTIIDVSRWMLCALMAASLLTTSAFSRGLIPPPPPFVGGNLGDWLGSGPIFGFDNPYGEGFTGGSGTGGFVWDPFGGSGGGGNGEGGGAGGGGAEMSCTCMCPCTRLNAVRCRQRLPKFCDPICKCIMRVELVNMYGPWPQYIPGKCFDYDGVVNGTGSDCCYQHDGCQIPNPAWKQ